MNNKWICKKYMKGLDGKPSAYPAFVWTKTKDVLQKLELEMELIIFDDANATAERKVFDDVLIITIEKQFSVDVYMTTLSKGKKGK